MSDQKKINTIFQRSNGESAAPWTIQPGQVLSRLDVEPERGLSEDEVKEFNASKDFFNSYVVLDFAQQEAYNLSQLKDSTEHYESYPLTLERARDLMEEIIEG